MPISTPLDRLFGRSPFRPLQQHMQRVADCTSELIPFIEAVVANDWQSAGVQQLKIAAMEREADDLKRDLRGSLPKRLFLPVSRADLLALLSAQDAVANLARDIAGIMTGRKMLIPESLTPALLVFVTTAVSASDKANQLLQELDELLEAGFTGRELRRVVDMVETLDTIEHETDEIEITLRAALQQLEHELPPVDVMFLYRIIDDIGGIADRAHSVGSRLEILLVD